MGFLDKVKSQAEQVAKQGQEKFGEVQAKRAGDALLRDLGAWYYATQTGRDEGQGADQLARLVGELHAHEAEHGPLGGDKGEADAGPAAPAPGASPAVSQPTPPFGETPASQPTPPFGAPDPLPGGPPTPTPEPPPAPPLPDSPPIPPTPPVPGQPPVPPVPQAGDDA